MRRNRMVAMTLAVAMLCAIAVGLIACGEDYGIMPLNNNTLQTVTSFGFTEDGYARVHVDYTGYAGTRGAHIRVSVERQRFFFLWEEIVHRDYDAVGESYQNEFYYPVTDEGEYRCTVVYTVFGEGEDDVITFEDTRRYVKGGTETAPPVSDGTTSRPADTSSEGEPSETTTPLTPPSSAVGEQAVYWAKEHGWAVLAYTMNWQTQTLVMASSYEGMPVQELREGAFRNDRGHLHTLILPDTMLRLSAETLEDAVNLRYNVYGDALYLGTATNPYYAFIRPTSTDIVTCVLHGDTEIIAAGAFRGCESLATVVLSERVKYVAPGVFDGCTALRCNEYLGGRYLGTPSNPYFSLVKWDSDYGTKLVLHADTVRMESFAVSGEITGAVLNLGLRTIAERAFSGTVGACQLTLPSGVSLDYGAFSGAELASLTIPADVSMARYACTLSKISSVLVSFGREEIPYGAFCGSMALSKVELPDSIRRIEAQAFQGCPLEALTLPEALAHIGAYAFEGARMTSLILPEGLTYIGERAFMGCDGLLALTIPDSVTALGEFAFIDCGALRELTVGDGLRELPYGAFESCSRLKTVTLSPGVRRIGPYAFNRCTSLSEIVIPEGVEDIGLMAFARCVSLREINLPLSLARFDNGIFFDARPERIHYPGTKEDFDAIVKARDWDRDFVENIVYGSTATALTPSGAES